MNAIIQFITDNIGTVITSSTITILLNYYYHRSKKSDDRYAYIYDKINMLLKVQLDNPHFRDDEYCNFIVDCQDVNKLHEQRKYDAYCSMVWNTLEIMHDKLGSRGLRKSPFFITLTILAKRHQKWLLMNGRVSQFKLPMISMLLERKVI